MNRGQSELVNGAGGGIGNLAVQFAKAKGAYVIGTATRRNFNFLKQLGADEVIDYLNENFGGLLQAIDVVFDASPVSDEAARAFMAGALKDGGRFVSVQIASPFSEEFPGLLIKKMSNQK
ncbi:MAG: zinc-binding dehydrogenase [Bacteroidota bacterium]|nr:zinc-binding dehydrogenase [Bacteroidota bacterium]